MGESPKKESKGQLKSDTSGGPNESEGKSRQGGGYQRFTPPQTKFEGVCDGMKGHIYDCGKKESLAMFEETTKMLAIHLGATCTHGKDIATSIEQLEEVKIPRPTLQSDATEEDKVYYREEVKIFVARKAKLEENLGKAYIVTWGQCTEALKANQGYRRFRCARTRQERGRSPHQD
jgi:hypothetical protein